MLGDVCFVTVLFSTFQLLQNLEYSEAVQVHVVNNGQEALDFSEYDLKKILA